MVAVLFGVFRLSLFCDYSAGELKSEAPQGFESAGSHPEQLLSSPTYQCQSQKNMNRELEHPTERAEAGNVSSINSLSEQIILSPADNALLRNRIVDLNDGFTIAGIETANQSSNVEAPTLLAQRSDFASESNRVTGELILNGQVVRRRMSEGPDRVVAYDPQGRAHEFPDNPITSMPVALDQGIPQWRREQLDQRANYLLRSNIDTTRPGGHAGNRPLNVDFRDVANIMDAVANAEDLTEREKARVFSTIVTDLRQSGKYKVSPDGAQEEVVDDWSRDDVWHAIIRFDDGYHGDRLINLPRNEALQVINNREIEGGEAATLPFPRQILWRGAQQVLGPNQGDVVSSTRQLDSLDHYLEGGFKAYARSWRANFVD
ncbi:MAG: hypothetical protein GC193_05250 [Cryomorphaceae bacterium]|nr:hypothetical protein [Cryomorphaceae bacterium]